MRTAICLSGHVRCYNKCYDSFMRNLILPISKMGKIDIFISTWTKTDSAIAGTNAHKGSHFNLLNVQNLYRPEDIEMEDFDEIKHLFKFKNFSNRKLEELKDDSYIDEIPFYIPMHYKIYKCNLLKKKKRRIRKF